MSSIASIPSPGHLDTAIIAITYVFVPITLLFTILRISVVLLRDRKLGKDDILLATAICFGFLSALCIGNAVRNGLARPIITVHAGQLANYFKLAYFSNIFTILAMAMAKHSLVALIERLLPQNSTAHRYIRPSHLAIISWMLFSAFGVAFQCDVPDPWLYQPSRCAGQGAIWYPIIATNIISDIVLALGFIPIMKGVQLDSKKKTKVQVLFLSRLIVPVFTVAYVATLSPALRSVDQTRSMAVPSIFAQIMMSTSIFTAAIPALSRIVTSLEPVSSTVVVSEITAVALDPSHVRATSDENKKLRDWALAQLRNTPTPSSLIKDMAVEINESPKKPESVHMGLERVDTAPTVPARSPLRTPSPRLTLAFSPTSSQLDVKEAWFVDSKRTSSTSDLTFVEGKTQVITKVP